MAACSRTTPTDTDETAVVIPTTPVTADRTVAEAAASVEGALDLDDMLPKELGGVELHTFAVGQDTVERLAVRLGVGAEALDVRNASEHGARFLQMYAVRAPGISGPELVEAWAAVAYPNDVSDTSTALRTVSGKAVTVVDAPSAAARLGTYYSYSVDATLLVVQAFDPAVAADALAVLP